jgi:uncharacterized protein YggU (UPF0235/DUF167 family)
MTAHSVKEIKVRVTPNASREYVEESPFDTLRIGVREPNDGNRANDRAREIISERYEVPVKNVMIIKGARSPSKIVRIYF